MIVGYCIRRVGDPPPDAGLRGRGQAEIRVVDAGELALWVSDSTSGTATLEEVQEHDRVVRSALQTATPLPLRFDARFTDEAAARRMLLDRQQELLASLDRVAGRVEIAVRVLWAVEPALPPRPEIRSGRAYLEALQREREAEAERRLLAESILDRLALHFAPLELPTVRRVLPERGVAGTLAHLVHRVQLHHYRTFAAEARDANPDVSLRFSGPWAPYSFV